MALETVTYISDLVVTNPAHSDGLNAADAHLRAIKSAIKTTFPNITGVVNASLADLNNLPALLATVNTNGISHLADTGVFFKTNATDGFLNTLAGDIDVQLQGNIAATFQRTVGANFFKVFGQLQATSANVSGPITATGEIKGPGITPIGASVVWFEDQLPTDGLWAWANGQIIANANTVAPILLARWGNRFGGNGTTTMGVPNMCEVAPVGQRSMGGAASRGLLATGAWNTPFGEATHVLNSTEMPSHFHSAGIYDPGHTHSNNANSANSGSNTGGGQFTIPATSGATISANTTGVRVNSSNGLDTTYSAGGGAAHNNVQPSTVVNWIIRIG